MDSSDEGEFGRQSSAFLKSRADPFSNVQSMLNDPARVLILYSGGTIGMIRGKSGFAPVPGFLVSR
jgi:L-asparaginase/Glu-tRNA(Gln) amidotransferase subunit D